jgi:uncharacterized membrane protein YozB (DUF420 family)
MTANDLPTINAIFNIISTIFLITGFVFIRRGDRDKHKKAMIAALLSSTLFLICYLIYHAQVGSVPYPHHDWTRPVYFIILIPHIILAAIMGPFIVAAVYHALRQQFDKHTKLVKWVWPVWIYVSISGVLIYFMLYGI